jgi:hypothetical protein
MTDADGLAAAPRGDPGLPSGSRIGDSDDGVCHRLLVRCRTGAGVLGLLGAAFLLIAAIRSWGMVSAGFALVAVGLLAGGALLAVRARTWSVVADITLPPVAIADAIIGAPRALSLGAPQAPLKRKLAAVVVPIHRFDGPQPGGGALIVHARADGAVLAVDDEVEIWPAGPRGVQAKPAGLNRTSEKEVVGGRFVIRRTRDGMVFLATSKLTDTW